MALYLFRKTINKLPGMVIKEVRKPDPEIVEGYNSRLKIGKICKGHNVKSVLLVTDKTLFALGYHEALINSLEKEKIKVTVFSEICSEPTAKIIKQGIHKALSCNAQLIIAMGGGSVLDSCKIIASGAKLKKTTMNTLLIKFLFVKGGTLPVIAIPTTAGTGAEITVGAIVKKREKGPKHSTVVCGLNISDVILDSSLMLKLPASVTAACGIDALSHGLEGVVSKVKVSKEDKFKSFDCVKLVLENLPMVLKDPSNVDARQKMSRAALYGGNAINVQLAGYVHAFAHTIGAVYHLPHGNAIALCLLPVFRFQNKKCSNKMTELSKYCNFSSTEEFYSALEKLIGQCNLSENSKLINKKDYRSLARGILKDSINYSSPVVLTKFDIFKILDQIRNQ